MGLSVSWPVGKLDSKGVWYRRIRLPTLIGLFATLVVTAFQLEEHNFVVPLADEKASTAFQILSYSFPLEMNNDRTAF